MEFPLLQKTSLWNALSPLGKSVYTPKGIFYWGARAAKEAEINGTVGIAQDDDGTISHLAIAEELVGEKIMQRVPKGKIFGYAPIEGVQSLREKWLKKMLQESPELAAYASLSVVTNGITHSLAIAGRMTLSPGDVLITADKSWENYDHIYSDVQGIKIVPYSLFHGHGELNIDAMIGTCREIAHQKGKVVLLLNFPHNQTGYMPTNDQAELISHRLHELIQEMPEVSFTVLLDDAYEGYVYGSNALAGSLLPYLFKPLPNFVVAKMDGISKVLLAYGYRVGFLTYFSSKTDGTPFSAEELAEYRSEVGTKIGGLVRAEISQVGHHGQIIGDALMDDLPTVEAQRAEVITMLAERWKMMMSAVEEGYKKHGMDKMWMDPCNGGFFSYINIKKGVSPREVAEKLLVEKKVGVVPSDQGIRVAFAGVPKEKITQMVEAIFEVVYS